jgi:hypothetical protein
MELVPALLVISYRDDELDRGHPLRVVLGDLARGARITRVAMTGLSRDAVGRLAEPQGFDGRELHERTAGNPFFVTEVLAAATEAIPHSVRDAVLARVARLTPAARDALDAIAVVPGRVEPWLLERLVASAESLDECLGSGVLIAERDGWVAFRHEIARLVVEESMPAGRRMALHRTVLAAEGKEGDLTRLAHHAEAAGDADAVLRFAPAAAAHASAAGARAPGSASVIAATAAMSPASMNASEPSPVGTTMVPVRGTRNVSLKFCMNHAGRTKLWLNRWRCSKPSSTPRMAASAGAYSMP